MIDMKQIKENVSSKLKSTDDEHITDTNVMIKAESSFRNQKTPMAIGSTIKIKGDVSGDEDLIIHGTVEGDINLSDHNVIIGNNGKVNANIRARQIEVEGSLKGDLVGSEKVIIKNTGNVLGNVIAPRVKLEDGAKFKGSIEMEPRPSVKPDKTQPGKDSRLAIDASAEKTKNIA